jgi:hypothetical protein
MTANGSKYEHPLWQHVIRQAQAGQREKDEQKRQADDAKRLQELEQKMELDARHLKEVLERFGIDVEPELGEVVLGGYMFALDEYLEWEINHSKNLGEKVPMMSFGLLVQKDTPDRDFDSPLKMIHYSGNRNFVHWHSYQVELADALDWLEAEHKRIQRAVAVHDERDQKLSTQMSTPVTRPSDPIDRIAVALETIAGLIGENANNNLIDSVDRLGNGFDLLVEALGRVRGSIEGY